MMQRRVFVVPHTHWDREWYRPFEAFRARLMTVLDGIIETLEQDDRWEGFHLDGQVALLDDYLELRPDAFDRIRKLAGAGRLAIGPWYVLMDEFCVSGETILRNLETGLESAGRFGTVSAVGYLPDMFGHVGQMPQILRSAGISHALVWRGVPSAVERTAFAWVAPDGSEVRAEYLPVGYASGAFLPDDPAALVRRTEALEAETQHFALDSDAPLLVMNGTDHQAIQAHLPRTLDSANSSQDRYRFYLTTLRSYLDAAPDPPARWRGELRSGARAPVLMGVLSNRRDLKVAAAGAERALERLAEPMATLWLPEDLWPGDSLHRAWLGMIRNSAHDSICGCSSDEVGRAVLHRYDGALAVAAGVFDDALEMAAVAMAADGPVVLNPSARPRAGIVEITLAGDQAPEGTQQVRAVQAGRTRREGSGRDLGTILGELARDGWLAVGDAPASAELAVTSGRVELDLACGDCGPRSPSAASVIAEAWALAGANSGSPLAVTVERPASQTVLARVEEVPGFGWRAWRPAALQVPPVEVGPSWMRNGLVDVEVDTSAGTFAVNGLCGLGRIVEEGDAGDTYDYCPPGGDRRVDSPSRVSVSVAESGPLRGRLRVTADYDWPSHLDGDTRAGSERVGVTTEVELLAGESAVRVTTGFFNRCRDHRVRIVFPLPRPAATTTAECAFATVERGGAEGGPREPGLATYPSRRWVTAGGVTVVHDGLLEHELLRETGELAVTVLRSTGVLSRPVLPTRPNAAGPPLPLEGPQMLGPVGLRYALAVGETDPWALADDVLLPLPVVRGVGTGHLPSVGTRLEVLGAEVSALRRRGGWIEVRVFNPTPGTRTVRIPGHRGSLVDITGRQVGAWEGSFDLGPWKIANARLEARSLD
jgi:mannosylglycerate hydrolase